MSSIKPTPLNRLTPTHRRRPIDWRWQRAVHLAKEPRASRTEDPLVLRLRKYVKDTYKLDRDEYWICNKYPDLYGARSIFEMGGMSRWTLEGYLLTGSPIEELAEKYGEDPEVVQLYHDCFFDVQDRLDLAPFINNNVLANPGSSSLQSHSQIHLIRSFGYLGHVHDKGTIMVDQATNRVSRMDKGERDFLIELAADLQHKAYTCAIFQGDPLRNPNALAVASQHSDLVRRQREEERTGGEDSMATIIAALGITYVDLANAPSIRAELRAHELTLPEGLEDEVEARMAEGPYRKPVESEQTTVEDTPKSD